MRGILNRPASTFASGEGFFRNEHFQMAYNTTDMDRALSLFAERYGVREFRRLEGNLPAGGRIRMEIGWAGGMMYELLWAEGPGSDVFRHGLPAEGFAIRHHHLGYLVPDTEAWNAVHKEVEKKGLKIIHDTDVPGFLKAIIVDEPVLGHFLEYIFPEQSGIAFFEETPSN